MTLHIVENTDGTFFLINITEYNNVVTSSVMKESQDVGEILAYLHEEGVPAVSVASGNFPSVTSEPAVSPNRKKKSLMGILRRRRQSILS